MGASISNETLTRGLVPDPVSHDLSALTLGAQRDPKTGLKRIVLGDEKFSVAVELNPKGVPRSLYVFGADNAPIMGLSLHGTHSWPKLCEVVLGCCEAHSTAGLQRYFKSRELAESLKKIDRFPKPEDLRESRRSLIDCQQFVSVTLPPEAEFNRRLDAIPFMNAEAFLGFAKPTQVQNGTSLIKSSALIGTENSNGWRSNLSDPNSAYWTATSIISNGTPWHHESRPVQIATFDGVSFVLGNSPIPVAVKGMNDDSLTIRANEISLRAPFRIVANSRAEAQVIEQRIKEGLFEAQVEVPGRVRGGGNSSEIYASWTVVNYTAPWVFSRDLELARGMHHRATSSG